METESRQGRQAYDYPYAINHQNRNADSHQDVNDNLPSESYDYSPSHTDQMNGRYMNGDQRSRDQEMRARAVPDGNRQRGQIKADRHNDQRLHPPGSGHSGVSYVRRAKSKDSIRKGTKSVRRKYYEESDMDDVLQEKIATQLRENGIAETKVVPLSAKITQAVRDDVIDANQNLSPQVTSNLAEVIHKHLDPILYNKANVTDLRDAHKARDATHLSNLVLMRVGQVHEEIELCKLSVDDERNKKGKGTTPRDDLRDRSMLMAIRDGIEKQKTEKEILRDKFHQAQRETEEVEETIHKRQGELQHLDTDNWNLRQDLNDAEHSRQDLLSKMKELQRETDQMDKLTQELRQENQKLKTRLNETEGQNQQLSGELTKLQSENAKLKVLASQKEKEILHLRDPDKDMVHKIRILSDEVTMLRTQSRRLNEEKALLKSRSQKMESSLEESNRQKGKLSVERDNLFRENQELKQRYRKLALANPQSRGLPDIATSRSGGPSSYNTPRTTSRDLSRSIQHSNERMSATLEDDEDEDYHR